MASTFEQFKQLHYTGDLLILPNAWNAKSAQLFQEKRFPAVATSSAAVAESMGNADGEHMSFEEYLFVIRRILASVSIPVTVDIEMGYAQTNKGIAENLLRLADLGVAGINIEDSMIQDGKRILKTASGFAATIEYIKQALHSTDLFLNIRCDTYILNVHNKQTETINRLPLYEAAGADGIFLPCIVQEDDIIDAVQHTQLPVNVMCVPGLPGFHKLQALGVKRVSMGPFLFSKTYHTTGSLITNIIDNHNFSPIL
jgi:2-methylisocitrate lyase-like PEP mutase family enzyme